MIILGDPRAEQIRLFQTGLLNSLGLLASQQLKSDLLRQQYENQINRAKELAKFKLDLENEQRKKLVRELLGQQQAEVINLDQTLNPGNIQQDINTAFNNARQQGLLFGAPGGSLIDRAMQNLPQLNLPKPRIKTQYKGGVLSEYANKDPFIASSIKAQIYGINLPKVEKPKPKVIKTDFVDLGDKKVAVAVIQNPDGTIKWTYDKEMVKGMSPKERTNFRIRLRELKEKHRHNLAIENIEKQKLFKQNKEINLSTGQLIRVLDQFSKKTSADIFGNKVEIPRNATYQDLKKAFSGKDIYITTKNGDKYKVIGIIDNKPLININGQGYRVVTERNGEPAVEINVKGKVIVVPISKIEKLKQRYQLNSTVENFTYNPQVGYKTAEDYLSKFGSK
ncbi:hypothetical protein [Persephonella sp.]|uniref:hypothetical protein n=1 Tax=Persephonella sp. TaxID=2060922 RepID=UPI0026052F3E|nr:hypothetical protein [Persephonella sp.]